METLSHKGYIGSIHYSQEDKVFWGKLELIDALVTFEANNAADLETNFIDAVEDYLLLCAEQNVEPQKPFKGTFNVRVGSNLHKAAYVSSLIEGVSMNKIVEEALFEHSVKLMNEHPEHKATLQAIIFETDNRNITA
jgi:predicted HicB family RNase H-like nuclease